MAQEDRDGLFDDLVGFFRAQLPRVAHHAHPTAVDKSLKANTLLDKGRSSFESAFASPAQGFVDAVGKLAPGFGQLIVEMEFGDIYNRPGLDLRTRELVIIASCAALGATGAGAVRMHVPDALRAGATRKEITKSLVQVAMAAGLPTALLALEAAHEVFVAIDAAEATTAAATTA